MTYDMMPSGHEDVAREQSVLVARGKVDDIVDTINQHKMSDIEWELGESASKHALREYLGKIALRQEEFTAIIQHPRMQWMREERKNGTRFAKSLHEILADSIEDRVILYQTNQGMEQPFHYMRKEDRVFVFDAPTECVFSDPMMGIIPDGVCGASASLEDSVIVDFDCADRTIRFGRVGLSRADTYVIRATGTMENVKIERSQTVIDLPSKQTISSDFPLFSQINENTVRPFWRQPGLHRYVETLVEHCRDPHTLHDHYGPEPLTRIHRDLQLLTSGIIGSIQYHFRERKQLSQQWREAMQ